MSELRWNPLLAEWVVTATHRQNRTFLPPADFCPLCPTRNPDFPTEIPESDFDFVVFENKFPTLQRTPPKASVEASGIYDVRPAQGVCEVVLYTPKHEGSLSALSGERVVELIQVWKDRYRELGSLKEIEYVFIFENRGESIGVTIPHPHGQIYAFPFVPPHIQKELSNEASHFSNTGNCLHCQVIEEENRDGRRLVASNDTFVAFVPFYARWPYEVHVYARAHRANIGDLTPEEDADLASVLQMLTRKYDNLWETPIPYIMVMHQSPTDGKPHPGSHFHIEFYPPNRTKEKMKFLAGCESGAGTFVNDTLPEEKAAELRATMPIAESLR